MAENTRPLVGLRVLLVEDEPDIAELLTFILQDAGAEVLETGSAGEALDILAIHSPDVLVCNIKLPDRDGAWLIQQIRTGQASSLPAIAVSSYSRDFSRDKVLDAGFQHFLAKPLEPEQLVIGILRLTQEARD